MAAGKRIRVEVGLFLAAQEEEEIEVELNKTNRARKGSAGSRGPLGWRTRVSLLLESQQRRGQRSSEVHWHREGGGRGGRGERE